MNQDATHCGIHSLVWYRLNMDNIDIDENNRRRKICCEAIQIIVFFFLN